MSSIKNEQPHSAYKRLEEDQPDITMNPYPGPTTAFINPMPNAPPYPNPNTMQYPNQSAMTNPTPNALAYPDPNAMAYPNPNAIAYPNPNAMAYPNPNAMAHPHPNAMPYPDSNATAQSDSKYAMAYPQNKYSTAPDAEIPSSDSEPPKPDDSTPEFLVQGFDFSEMTIRRMFVRKVYAVLVCQLLLTIAITAFFMFCEPVRLFARNDSTFFPLIMTMSVISFSLVIVLVCTNLRRVAPWNLIFLGIFTAVQGVMIGVLGAVIGSNDVLIAFGITTVVVFALMLFAFQTKWDFTTLGGGLLSVLVVLSLFGVLAACMPHYRTMRLVYSIAGVILFSFYIIYDTQLMIGGKHKYQISPEEYVAAALTLYLDILNLFLYILRALRS